MTRRDLLALAGGSAFGALFSPVPWKLLDDSAIWTQNWSLIPPLPHGSQTLRTSACTLCGSGCGVSARILNGYPVALSGIPRHPLGNGVLCPLGLAGHHMAFHPLRLTGCFQFDQKSEDSVLVPIRYEDVIRRLGEIVSRLRTSTDGGAIAILDQRPGRALSWFYKEFLSRFPYAFSLVPPARENCTLTTLAAQTRNPRASFGLDIEHAETILSFGAAVADGWGSPGRMHSWLNARKTTGRQLIQVEAVRSRTAGLADVWLPARPGTEGLLALGLANVLLHEGLVPERVSRAIDDLDNYRSLVAPLQPQQVAEMTGVPSPLIEKTARILARSRSIVLAGPDAAAGPFDAATEAAIAGLNLLLGSVGRDGGVLLRRELPVPDAAAQRSVSLAEIPDHSLALLLLDAADSGYGYPVSLLKRKLVRSGGVVIQLSPFLSALSSAVDYFLPASAPYESVEEVVAEGNAVVASMGYSRALFPVRSQSIDPVVLITDVARAAGMPGFQSQNSDALLRRKSDVVYSVKRGHLHEPSGEGTRAVTSLSDAGQLVQALENGEIWIDDPCPQVPPAHCMMMAVPSRESLSALIRMETRKEGTLVLVPNGLCAALGSGSVAPILSKIFQESDLRKTREYVGLNPATASESGLGDGAHVRLTAGKAMREARVYCDSSLMPGIALAAVGPAANATDTPACPLTDGLMGLAFVRDDGTWRSTEVTITKA